MSKSDPCSQSDDEAFDSVLRDPQSRDAQSESLASLSNRLQELEDKLNESKFYALFVGVFVLDCWLFTFMPSSGIFCLFGLEVAGLFIAARRLGIEEVEVIVDKVQAVLSNIKAE